MNASLCIFYVCWMGFQLHIETMKKYCEPVLVLCPILFAAVCSALPLAFRLYNPSPYDASCILYTKDSEVYALDSAIEETSLQSIVPEEVEEAEKVSVSQYFSFINAFVSYLSINLIVIIVSFITLFIAFTKKERAQREEYALSSRLRQQTRRTKRASRRQIRALHRETRCMTMQAAAYISVYAFTHIVFIYGLKHAASHSKSFHIFTSSIVPLQGIFNCIIFIAHKCHALNLNYDGSNFGIIRFVLFGMNTQDPILFHDFNLVKQDQLQNYATDDSSIKSDENVLPLIESEKQKKWKKKYNQNRNPSSVTYTGVRFDLSPNSNELDKSQHAKQEINSNSNLFLEEELPKQERISTEQETASKSSSYKALQGFSFGDDINLDIYRNYQRVVEDEADHRITEETRNNSSQELDLDEFHEEDEELCEERKDSDGIEEDEEAQLNDGL